MAFLFAHPPTPSLQHTSRRISPAAALQHIRTYLDLTATQPHLHPDCRFNERGPTLEGRPPGGGLILHQLGRVAKGLAGERLVPEEEERALNGVDVEELAPVEQDDVDRVPSSVENEQGLKSYGEQMREQGEEEGIVVGEVGRRSNIVADEGRTSGNKMNEGKKRDKKRKRDEDGEEEDGREARKRAKKERKVERKRAAEEAAEDEEIRRKREKKERREEKKKRRRKVKHESDTEADGVADEEVRVNGQHNHAGAVSPPTSERNFNSQRSDKSDKKARKEAKKRAKKAKEQGQTNGWHEENTPTRDIMASQDLSPPKSSKHKKRDKKTKSESTSEAG